MKKTYALIIMIMIFMTACQPTPEEEPVSNKADGNLQNKIEATAMPVAQKEITENSAGQEKEKWQINFEKGRIFITVNAEVDIPDVEKYPVLSIAPIEMNQEWADKAYDVFFKGATSYKWEITKEESETRMLILKRVQEQIKNGNYSIGFQDRDYEYIQQEIDVLMDIYEDAPYESELIVADTAFEEMYNGQFTLSMLDIVGKVGKSSFARLSIVNNWTIKHNSIQFYNYDNNAIKQKTVTSEYNAGDILNGVSLSCEQAQQIADRSILEVGIEGVELKEINTVDIYEVLPRMNQDISESDIQAYEFIYEKTYNGIPVSYFRSRMVTKQTEDGVDTNAYSAVLEPERLAVQVDDSGIVFFDWKNPTTSNGIINENVQLLPFEKIKEIFEKNIFYHYFYESDEGSLDIFIDKIVLSYFVQPVMNANNEYIAIPVWDFINEGSGEINSGRANTYLTINAIDGTVINRDKGY